MSSRRNFLDADNNIMERNLRFVQNDLEDNLNQYFGGSGSRGNSTAISAPPRDYKVVQPKPVDSLIPITSIGLDERKEFLRQIGLARHEAYDLAKEKNFDVKYYREKREEWRKFGDKQQADTRILLEIKRANYKRSDGRNVAGEPAANFHRKSFTRNYVRSTEITIAEAPPPPIISNIQIEQYQTATERYTINKEITTNYAAAFEHVFNNTLKRPSTEEPKTIYISDSEADTDSQRCLNKNNTLQEPATETTPYVKMSSGEKRKFKRALAEGRTREEALQLVGPKKPRFESNKIYQKLSTQDIINCDTDTQTYPQSSVINSSQKSPIYVPFVKLTSTEKRRFKRALDEGLTREVAIALVKTTKPYETKRALSVVPFVKLSQPSATTQAISSKPSHSQIPNNIKIGLVSQDINRPLTSRQIEILQESIIDTTIEFGNYAKPEFNGCHPRKGWLMINCVNKITADWVKAHIETIMEKSNCSLKVVDESEFPRSHYIRGYLPHSQDLSNEKVLATIASQNGLDSKDWKVVMRKTEDSLLHLIMVVDDSSWSKLKELNGRVAYRFGHVKLMLKNVNAKEQVVQTAAATDGNELEHYVLPLDEGPSTSRAAMMNFVKRPTRNIRSVPFNNEDMLEQRLFNERDYKY